MLKLEMKIKQNLLLRKEDKECELNERIIEN